MVRNVFYHGLFFVYLSLLKYLISVFLGLIVIHPYSHFTEMTSHQDLKQMHCSVLGVTWVQNHLNRRMCCSVVFVYHRLEVLLQPKELLLFILCNRVLKLSLQRETKMYFTILSETIYVVSLRECTY
jgi:hypothetical protein